MSSNFVVNRSKASCLVITSNFVTKAWIPALSTSLIFCGAIPGMIFFGWFADKFGRIPTTIVSNVICLVAGMVTPFVTDHVQFLVLRFILGLGFNTFITTPFILGKFSNCHHALSWKLIYFSDGVCSNGQKDLCW